MLVYTKNPLGYTTINGKRVYGEYYAHGSFGPTNLSLDVVNIHRDVLREVPVTKEWLDEKTGEDFPDVSFYRDTLKRMDFSVCVEIAQKLGIPYKSSRNPTRAQKRTLFQNIIKRVDAL